MKRALAVLTTAAFVTLVVDVVGSGGSAAPLLPGAAFALLGTVGVEWVHRRDRPAWAAGYVVVQLGSAMPPS